MSEREFRILLNWFMVSDPWPLSKEDNDEIRSMLDEESVRRGFSDWVDAYHNHVA